MQRLWGIAACVVAACAPVTTHVRTDESVINRREDPGKPIRSERVAAIDTDAQLSIVLNDHDTCSIRTIERVQRTQHTDRSVNKTVVVLEYIFGIGLAGAGGFAVGDPDDVSANLEPTFTLDHDETLATGATMAGVGALALVLGIVDSTRGGSSVERLPVEDRPLGAARETGCGDRPVAGEKMVVVAGDRVFALAPTDAAGKTTASWDALAQLFEGPAPPDRAAIHVGDAKGVQIGEVALAKPRGVVIDRAWAAAQKDGTAHAAFAFHKRFPDAHTADVQARIAANGDVEMDAAVGAALDKGDVAAASSLFAEWSEMVPSSDRRAARQATVAARERDAKVATLSKQIEDALAAQGDPKDLASLTRAQALAGELQRAAPDDARTTDAQSKVATARRARQSALLDRAKESIKAGQLDEAVELADLAVEANPDDTRAPAQRDDLKKKVARQYAQTAREQARKHDYDGAEASMSKAEAILPGDREVVSSRKRVDAARAVAEAAIADAAERQRKKEEREKQEADLRAQRDAERQKREDDKRAREEERKRIEEDAKAQREAEKQAKLDEARQKAEADRQAAAAAKAAADKAAADKAAADKVAADKASADKAAAAKADADRKKADADRQAAAAKADADRRRAAQPRTPAPPRVATASDAAEARVLTGVWAAAGTIGGERVTLILYAGAGGSGVISAIGESGRLLARQDVTWGTAGGGLSIAGANRLAMRGGAYVRGDSLTWAGYTWHRVRGRASLPASAPAATTEDVK
ncbi:MAG TPA: hypothetical protein VL463_21770 [Kofleriaceae bacterium]|nr:hypothetical protein [Kofleriaceae bacterium]